MTSARFAQDATSVGRARAFVAAELRAAPEELRDRAVLITSELATNAVLHAQTAFVVEAILGPAEIRVAVTDDGGGVPVPRRPDGSETSGRGLLIATSLSDHWGIEARGGSTTVWFVLAMTPESSVDGRV